MTIRGPVPTPPPGARRLSMGRACAPGMLSMLRNASIPDRRVLWFGPVPMCEQAPQPLSGLASLSPNPFLLFNRTSPRTGHSHIYQGPGDEQWLQPHYLDNRSTRRAGLVRVEEQARCISPRLPTFTQSPHPRLEVFREFGFRPLRIDVWGMAGTRLDRYKDATHVYPHGYLSTPPTLATTQTEFLKNVVCAADPRPTCGRRECSGRCGTVLGGQSCCRPEAPYCDEERGQCVARPAPRGAESTDRFDCKLDLAAGEAKTMAEAQAKEAEDRKRG